MKTNLPKCCPQCGQVISEGVQGLCPNCLGLVAFSPDQKSGSDDTTVLEMGRKLPGGSSTPAPLLPATTRYFGDYELVEEIARGGMGVVYKALQTSLNRTVAIKMILSGQLATEAEVKRFRTEAEAAANLRHKNIIAIHEVGQHEGRHYFSMEYVRGQNLAEWVRTHGPVEPTQAARWLRTIADAVQYANQRGVLHRDLKPQNILIDEDGEPRITDFGLAKKMGVDQGITGTGTMLGSPAYMPPEQATGHLSDVGPHSEVYALGGILYFCLTGRAPFHADSAVATIALVLDKEPESPEKANPGVPADLATICLKCLEKKTSDRYPNAQALAQELDRFLEHEPILAKPPSALRRAWNWTQRHPWVLVGFSSVVVLALAGVAYGFWQNHQRFLWLLKHGPLQPTALYLPVLAFWTWIFPAACVACFFGGSFFRRRYAPRQRGRAGWFRLIWISYIMLGLTTLMAGLWGLSSVVKLTVWLQNTSSALTALMTIPWAIGLVWLGAHTLWEAAGAHESSLFGGLVDESVQQYLKYHPNRWTLWEIVTCTVATLLGYVLTAGWLARFTEDLVRPGQLFSFPSAIIFEMPYLLSLPLAALVYPAGLLALAKTPKIGRFTLYVALGIALSALLLSGRWTPDPAETIWNRHLLAYTAEKGANAFVLPPVFLLTVVLFEKVPDRRTLLRRTIVLVLVNLFLSAILALFFPEGYRTSPSLYFWAIPVASILAYPIIILRSRLGSHHLERTQLSGPLFSLRALWTHKLAIGSATVALCVAVLIENWRGARAWSNAQAAWVAQKRPARYADLVPALVPETNNFWKTPIVQRWGLVRHETSRPDDTKARSLLTAPSAGVPSAMPTFPRGYDSLGAIPYGISQLKTLPKTAPSGTPAAPNLSDLNDWFAQSDVALDTLRQAVDLPYAQLDAPPLSSRGYYLAEVAPSLNFVRIRVLAQVLASRSSIHLLRNEPDRALADLKTLKGLMRTLESKPQTLISAAIRMAIGNIYLGRVAEGLKDHLWPPSSLQTLQEEIAPLQVMSPIYDSLITERNAACEVWERFVRAPLFERVKAFSGGGDLAIATIVSGWTRQNQAAYTRLMGSMLHGFEAVPGQVDSIEVKHAEDTVRRQLRLVTPYNLLVQISFPNCSKLIATARRNQAYRDLVLVALALEQFRNSHNQYPEKLDQLIPQFIATLPGDSHAQTIPYRYVRISSDSFKLAWGDLEF